MNSTRVSGSLWCIVLAAGGSSRLGQAKQLLRLGGRPLLARTVRIAASLVGSQIVVVLGAQSLRMRRLLQAQYPPPDVIRNGHWHQGQSSSLVCGLSRLPRSCLAALILLTDQPQIKAQDLRRLAIAWRRRPGVPAAAAYAGRVGVPAILPRRHFAAARKLKGDVGARAILRGAPRLTTVAIESAAFDLDTPADLERLNSLNQRLWFGTAAWVAQLTQPVTPEA